MGQGFDLSSIFGGGAQAGGLGSVLSGLTSGLGSGLGGGQSIGGGTNAATNNAIADALGWTYGYGDQTGSITASQALGVDGQGGDGAGPSVMGTAQQYMQGQQQGTPAPSDTGQTTPAQQAMAQQAPVSLTQAYGAQGPWAPGGSTDPAAAAQGPQGFTQVAGPAQAATGPGGQAGMPAQQPVPNFFSSPQGYNLPGSAGPAGSAARGTVGLGGVTDAINAQRGAAVGELPNWATQNIASPMRSTQSLGEPIYDQSQVNPMDPVGGGVSLPQPRPAVADAAPVPPRVAAPPAAARAPVSLAPPPANDPAAGAIPQGAGQGAQQNPIQAVMQALGLQNLPPQMQQAAQQIIRQVLSQLMPQLQGMMGGQQGQQPFGGGQGAAIDPRTGQPPINPKTGQPYPAGTRWDQIAWSQGWDPAKQQQGVPWKQWEPAPGASRDGRSSLGTTGFEQPSVRSSLGTAGFERVNDAGAAGRSPSESGAPTALPTEIPPGGSSRRSVPDLRGVSPRIQNPVPASPDYHDPREWQYHPDGTWGPHHLKKPPPGINLPPEKTAANLPNRSMKDRMTPDEIRRQELDFEKGGMTPQQMKKLRERIKKLNDDRKLVAQVGGSKTGRRDAPASELLKQRIETGPNQPVIGYPPPGNTPWGYNQPYFDPITGQMVRPNNDPNRDRGSNWIDPYFRGM